MPKPIAEKLEPAVRHPWFVRLHRRNDALLLGERAATRGRSSMECGGEYPSVSERHPLELQLSTCFSGIAFCTIMPEFGLSTRTDQIRFGYLCHAGPMQEWEYKVFASHLDPAELVVLLDESGRQGWELVTVIAVTDRLPVEVIDPLATTQGAQYRRSRGSRFTASFQVYLQETC